MTYEWAAAEVSRCQVVCETRCQTHIHSNQCNFGLFWDAPRQRREAYLGVPTEFYRILAVSRQTFAAAAGVQRIKTFAAGRPRSDVF